MGKTGENVKKAECIPKRGGLKHADMCMTMQYIFLCYVKGPYDAEEYSPIAGNFTRYPIPLSTPGMQAVLRMSPRSVSSLALGEE